MPHTHGFEAAAPVRDVDWSMPIPVTARFLDTGSKSVGVEHRSGHDPAGTVVADRRATRGHAEYSRSTLSTRCLLRVSLYQGKMSKRRIPILQVVATVAVSVSRWSDALEI